MRLTCPSCASEYDVDAAAIGARGRMVRCANCEAEWFQSAANGDAAAPPPPLPGARARHNDFLWAKILLLHAENLFIDFGAES